MGFLKVHRRKLSVGLALTILSGAAFIGAAAADPVPRIQDCGIVSISSPSKYICNGKVYTTYQLQHLRENSAAASTDHVSTLNKVQHPQERTAKSKVGS